MCEDGGGAAKSVIPVLVVEETDRRHSFSSSASRFVRVGRDDSVQGLLVGVAAYWSCRKVSARKASSQEVLVDQEFVAVSK